MAKKVENGEITIVHNYDTIEVKCRLGPVGPYFFLEPGK